MTTLDLSQSVLIINRNNESSFELDLIDAYLHLEPHLLSPEKTGLELVSAVRSYVEKQTGITLSTSESAELLHAIPRAYASYKKKLDDKLTSCFGTESTPPPSPSKNNSSLPMNSPDSEPSSNSTSN